MFTRPSPAVHPRVARLRTSRNRSGARWIRSRRAGHGWPADFAAVDHGAVAEPGSTTTSYVWACSARRAAGRAGRRPRHNLRSMALDVRCRRSGPSGRPGGNGAAAIGGEHRPARPVRCHLDAVVERGQRSLPGPARGPARRGGGAAAGRRGGRGGSRRGAGAGRRGGAGRRRRGWPDRAGRWLPPSRGAAGTGRRDVRAGAKGRALRRAEGAGGRRAWRCGVSRSRTARKVAGRGAAARQASPGAAVPRSRLPRRRTRTPGRRTTGRRELGGPDDHPAYIAEIVAGRLVTGRAGPRAALPDPDRLRRRCRGISAAASTFSSADGPVASSPRRPRASSRALSSCPPRGERDGPAAPPGRHVVAPLVRLQAGRSPEASSACPG